MKLVYSDSIDHLKYSTKKLLNRMLHPSYGLVQEIGFLNTAYNNPNLLVAGGVLTGIHVLQGRKNPGRAAYHIGGCGFYLEEAIIKTLAESIERYAQLLSELSNYFEIKFSSYNDMLAQGYSMISFEKLKFFTDQQFSQIGFPFTQLDKQSPLSWVELKNAVEDSHVLWVPAQLVFFGYRIKNEANEPWLNTGVSTGTATHLTYLHAKRNALLELIQLDSAIGHWYGDSKAKIIKFDSRTRFFSRFLQKVSVPQAINIKFCLLPNPDLKGFAVAAVLYNDKQRRPKVSIGLGADTHLERAMYKAFLEGVSTLALARLEIYRNEYALDGHREQAIDPNRIYDLDANAEYYGRGYHFELIESRFLNIESVPASDLPPDMSDKLDEQIQALLDAFVLSKKAVYEIEMKLAEVKALGFYVSRVWSPDTLSLCLPSIIPKEHIRFQAYGGVVREDPHPYP